ncbi:MAG: response regulator [Desulfamplus sp.]|nr:response regulator [Desulfamplus sp.]
MSNILIIDDSWLTRRGLKRILEGDGHAVIEAENGRMGMEILKNNHAGVDLVILDLLMPEMNGVLFLETLQKDKITVPVVVLTADIQHTVKEKCIGLGADAFLNKPPDPGVMLSTIHKILNDISGG